MPEFEKAGYKGLWLPGQRLNGHVGVAFVVKRRFDIDLASAECSPAEETPPVRMTPELEDEEDPMSPLVLPAEIAIEKAKVDVIVLGTAYAPMGKPATEFDVGLKISGTLDVKLRVYGKRVAHWVEPDKWVSDKDKEKGVRQEYPPPVFSEPAEFDKLPLSYRFAYGGQAIFAMLEEEAEIAAEHQEEAEIVEKRNQRKKELVDEMVAEEEKKQAEEDKKKSGDAPKYEDEDLQDKVEGAFEEDIDEMRDPDADRVVVQGVKEGGTQVLDTSMLEKLEQEDAEKASEMKVVSELKLGKDLPDKPEEAEAEAEDGDGEGEGEGDEEAEAKPEGEHDEFFTESEGSTKMVDISQLDGTRDEYKEMLDARTRDRARKLRDGEKVLRDRATEFGDIQLSDDEWIAKYGDRPRPEPPKKKEKDHPWEEVPYPANPVGLGYCVREIQEAVDGVELPRFEWPDEPLTPLNFVRPIDEDWNIYALPAPAGMGPYPMGWFPRAGYGGCPPWALDEAEKSKLKALEDLDPDDPEDQQAIETIKNTETPVLRPEFFQEANPRLQVERLDGDEEVLCTNLTPDGNLYFKLPARHPKTTFDMGEGPRLIEMNLDSILIDLREPKEPGVELIWRGWHRLRSFDQLEEATRFDVEIENVSQDHWFELLRDAEMRRKKKVVEGTVAIKAMEDHEEIEGDEILGEEAERRYRDEVQAAKYVGKEGDMSAERLEAADVGRRKDVEGTAIFDQEQGRKLADDWEVDYQDPEYLEKLEEERKKAKDLRLKEIRKKAREQADEEFGIERVEVPVDEED